MNIGNSMRFGLLLSALLSTAAHADPVDDLVAAEMERSKTPGVAIAVVDEGRLARVQSFGQADIEHGVPVHPDTMFKIGATGMQLTAAAVMLLVEDGKIELDAPVKRYLSGVPAKWAKVTVRQLLDHTSGLPATPNGDFRAEYTNAELLDIIGSQDINSPAGARWRFSYAGYIVLGFMIEEVTGEHWTKFMDRRIFKPLGMQSARGIDEMAIIPNRSTGYELREKGLRNAEWISQTANSTADGSLYLSVLDYAAWANAVSQRRLLSAKSWDILAKKASLGDGQSCAYVPGWSTDRQGKQVTWSQAGSWQGFQTYTLRYPGRDLTVVVYANGEKADARYLARSIAGLTDPALAGAPASPRSDADANVTAKARALIEAIVAGRTTQSDFVDFAELDYNELTALYAGMLGELGPLSDFALFDRPAQCGETLYRYRARFAKGVVEIRMGLASNGKVATLDIVPLKDWNEPL